MRLLMTTDTIGGVWTLTRELAEGLLNRGCAIALVSFGQNPTESQRCWADDLERGWGERFRYYSSDAPLEWMEDNECAYGEASALLIRIAEEFGAELLHSNQFCFGAIPLDIPKIVTAHSDVFSWADCCRNGVLEDSLWLQRYRALVATGLAEADAIVAPTQWMAGALARNFPLPREVTVIPNGISALHIEACSRKLQAVTAGRLWDEAKNISLLREVRSSIPVLVAGETQHGSSEVAPSLGQAVLLGQLTHDELLKLFCESAIYICTSRYEPFGLAPLEAALHGCAVLAYDFPSLHEVWGEGALYFSSAASLANVLSRLCDEPTQLHAAQRRSLRRGQRFTVARMTENYLQLFQGALTHSEDGAYVS